MRTFRYRCGMCGHEFTRDYEWTEPVQETARCPECGERALRQLPRVNVHYNGKGYTKAVTRGGGEEEQAS